MPANCVFVSKTRVTVGTAGTGGDVTGFPRGVRNGLRVGVVTCGSCESNGLESWPGENGAGDQETVPGADGGCWAGRVGVTGVGWIRGTEMRRTEKPRKVLSDMMKVLGSRRSGGVRIYC